MRLRYFLIVVFFTVALAPIALLASWPRNTVLDSEYAEVHERHLLIAQNLAAALTRYHRDLSTTFELIISDTDSWKRSETAGDILSNLSFRHICVADPATGTVLAQIEHSVTPCPEAIPAPVLQDLLGIAQTDTVAFGPVRGEPDGTNVMHMTQMVDGNLVVGAISTSYFVELGKSITFGVRGHAAIVDHLGNVLSHPLDSWIADRRSLISVSAVQRMMNGETGVEQFFSPALKGDMIAGFTSVEPVGWGVMIPQPVSELHDKALRAMISVVVVLLFGAAIALGFAVWVSVMTARPLEWICDQTKRVADGDLTLPTDLKAPIFLPVEFQRAQKHIREMMIRLRFSINGINRLAYVDPVTGLANREYFRRRLTLLTENEGLINEGTLLFIDLDGFKEVNDTFGHELGDKVLKAVADRMCDVCQTRGLAEIIDPQARPGAEPAEPILCRLGGDEFAIFLPDMSAEDSLDLAQRLLARITRPLNLESRNAIFGASIGLARFPEGGNSAASLLNAGDLAMYDAKSRGKGQVSVFRGHLRDEQQRRNSLGSELQWALELDQLVPHFQPQFDANDMSLAGLEALVRWQHPTRGILEPGDFLPVAEEMGLVAEIDRLVLHKSVAAVREMIAQGIDIPSLSVNISSARLASSTIVSDVKALGPLPFQLKFELLETIFLDNIDNRTAQTIKELDGIGILIEMDDFGSGHASIIALLNLRPKTLKIDRQLVAQITEDNLRLGLVRTIVDMGNSLGIRITAEGVETQAQVDILKSVGCDTLQGRHLSYPMDAQDICRTFAEPGFERAATG